MAENAHSTPVPNAERETLKRDVWLRALGEEYRLLEDRLDDMRRVSVALEIVFETMMAPGNRIKDTTSEIHYAFLAEHYDALSHLIYDLGTKAREAFKDWECKLEELKSCA